jgi:hypothetical protein
MYVSGKWHFRVDCEQAWLEWNIPARPADSQLTCRGVITQLTEDKQCIELVIVYVIQGAWST